MTRRSTPLTVLMTCLLVPVLAPAACAPQPDGEADARGDGPSGEAPGAVPAEQDSGLTDSAERFISEQDNIYFVLALPDLRMAAYEEAEPFWDSGVTARMHQGNQIVIDFLQESWLRLASFYPQDRFEGGAPEARLADYIDERQAHHRAALGEEGMGGTMLGVMVGGEIIDDLEGRVAEIVEDVAEVMDLSAHSALADYDYASWRQDWERDFGSAP